MGIFKVEVYRTYALFFEKTCCICGRKWIREKGWRILGPPIMGSCYTEYHMCKTCADTKTKAEQMFHKNIPGKRPKPTPPPPQKRQEGWAPILYAPEDTVRMPPPGQHKNKTPLTLGPPAPIMKGNTMTRSVFRGTIMYASMDVSPGEPDSETLLLRIKIQKSYIKGLKRSGKARIEVVDDVLYSVTFNEDNEE